jgi:hypothetical protein
MQQHNKMICQVGSMEDVSGLYCWLQLMVGVGIVRLGRAVPGPECKTAVGGMLQTIKPVGNLVPMRVPINKCHRET